MSRKDTLPKTLPTLQLRDHDNDTVKVFNGRVDNPEEVIASALYEGYINGLDRRTKKSRIVAEVASHSSGLPVYKINSTGEVQYCPSPEPTDVFDTSKIQSLVNDYIAKKATPIDVPNIFDEKIIDTSNLPVYNMINHYSDEYDPNNTRNYSGRQFRRYLDDVRQNPDNHSEAARVFVDALVPGGDDLEYKVIPFTSLPDKYRPMAFKISDMHWDNDFRIFTASAIIDGKIVSSEYESEDGYYDFPTQVEYPGYLALDYVMEKMNDDFVKYRMKEAEAHRYSDIASLEIPDDCKWVPFGTDPEMDKLATSSFSNDRMSAAEKGYGLDVLINDEDYWVRKAVVSTGFGRNVLANDSEEAVRGALAKQGYALDKFINDPSGYVRTFVARQGYGLDKLVDDESENVRAAVAKHGYGLEKLVNDKHFYVRQVVASQGYGLDKLIRDDDYSVCYEAKAYLHKHKISLEEWQKQNPDKCALPKDEIPEPIVDNSADDFFDTTGLEY